MAAQPASALPPDSSDAAVLGAYRLLDRVATGGTATVWRALAPDGGIVALKLLDAAASGTPAERRRFLRGFRLASILDHPGIARLIAAGEHEGRLYVVEEYIEGETLADRLRAGRLPVEEALRILRKCAEILAYAHQSGVVHRDLSPRNLMIEASGRVVLVDFGIAVRPEGTTQAATMTLLGTLNYLAPELIRGKAASARSDLYALGAIAYQMLTGTPPFVATQPEALIRLHLSQRPAGVRTLRPEVDPRLDRVVLRLLAKAPADRFNNAEAVLRALDEATAPRRRVRATGGPRRAPAREARAIQRLAIAPFTADLDDGSDPDRMARVARGLAETVAAGLAGVEGLTVAPPSQVAGTAPATIGELAEAIGVDAVLGAHLAQRDDVRRLSWTLTGRDGTLLEGGRIGGAGETLFALEDALLEQVIRALRRPGSGRRLRAGTGAREGWYAPFLEALGCLQRSDNESSVDRAIALLEEIRDAGAGGVQVHAALGRAYLRRAEIRRDPQWRKSAEASCRIAISLDPLAPEAMITMGRVLVSSGRAGEGVSILRRALDLAPANVDAKIWLSRAYEMSGDFSGAHRMAREACDERPELWVAHDRRAVLDFRQGRFADAAAGWTRVLELTPDNARAHAKLGAALFEQGELEAAEEAYRTSIQLGRTAAGVAGLGSVLFHQGRRAEAIHWFRLATELTPGHSQFWGQLADAQRWVPGEREASRSSFERAIELAREDLRLNPTDGRTWCQLALYLAKLEQHAEAARALSRGLELDASSSEARVCAIVVHELGGRRPEALQALRGARAAGEPPFELRADPELAELRAAPEARDCFRLPPPDLDVDLNPNPRSVSPWSLERFPSA